MGDLGSFLKGRQGQLMPEADVMLWFVQICLALQHVHQGGILHRDLKACNIFCTSNNLVKLGDFGISKVGCLHGSTQADCWLLEHACLRWPGLQAIVSHTARCPKIAPWPQIVQRIHPCALPCLNTLDAG